MSSEKAFDVVPTYLAVEAMRDNGYKNAAYAIAELIDNSVQATAKTVELLCEEQEMVVSQRKRRRVDRVAVLDDGYGMDAATLRMALQFGNGTHLGDRKGIGRFGMGLPSASISQCKRVDVWSWQGDPSQALYTFIDIDMIKARAQTEVPEPILKPLPSVWTRAASKLGRSGTLVVWSNIDRCMWKTAKSIMNNSEFLIGRMYRRFLARTDVEKVTIRMAAFIRDQPEKVHEDRRVKPNDPLYLMKRTSCPAPWSSEPMFKPYGDNWEATVSIECNDERHDVVVRFAVAKEEAREGVNPGQRPHGKHAAKNIGVSVMRANRELDMDTSLIIEYDPVERWWGIEVDFPPELDEIFGVSNNKQTARNFAEICRLDMQALLKEGQSITEIKEAWQDEGNPIGSLYAIRELIETNLSYIRKVLKRQSAGKRTVAQKRYLDPAVEAATRATKKRREEEGRFGESDGQEQETPEDRKKAIRESLLDEGATEQEADQLSSEVVDQGLKYLFTESDLESSAFFSVRPKGGALHVTINTSHPAYEHLVVLLKEGHDEIDSLEEAKGHLSNALTGLRIVLAAWARYEDEQPTPVLKDRVRDMRSDWGRIARQFFSMDE